LLLSFSHLPLFFFFFAFFFFFFRLLRETNESSAKNKTPSSNEVNVREATRNAHHRALTARFRHL
jgi:hypothetical protein